MFEVNCIYSGKDGLRRQYYLWVLQISISGIALRGVVYDDTFSLVARRWFRVRTYTVRGSICNLASLSKAYASASLVFAELDLVQDSACIPPEEVLDYFRNEKLAQ